MTRAEVLAAFEQSLRKRLDDWLESTSEVYARRDETGEAWRSGLVSYLLRGPGALDAALAAQEGTEPCAEFGSHPRGGHAARAAQGPPADAQGGGGEDEHTPDDPGAQPGEGAVPGTNATRIPAEWPGRQPSTPHRAQEGERGGAEVAARAEVEAADWVRLASSIEEGAADEAEFAVAETLQACAAKIRVVLAAPDPAASRSILPPGPPSPPTPPPGGMQG